MKSIGILAKERHCNRPKRRTARNKEARRNARFSEGRESSASK